MAHPLEQFYPWLPVPLQNLGISLFGLAWRHERLGGEFEREVRGFRQRELWTGERMQNHVETKLRHTLTRAFHQVPYYQRVWRANGIERFDLARMTMAGLVRLPITPKEDLRAEPESFVARDVAGANSLRRYYSSGSTGTPITAICTAREHRRFIAAREARSFGWAGSSIRHSRAMIGGRRVVPAAVARPPFHRYNWAERQVYFSAYHVSPANAVHYARAFNRHRPQLLTGYANSYFLLGRMLLEQNLALDYEPEAAVLCSEKLTTEMKRVIRRAFRARAFEEYGAVENCALATECERGRLHVSPDFGVLELVDDRGHPVPPGREGRVLCTSLLNDAQPLIRYEIGDVGVWSAKGCPCGRDHLPVLEEIVGRLEDVVVGADGRQLVRFHGLFVDLPQVIEGQVIQEALDQFTLKVVTQADFGPAHEQILRARLTSQLGPVRAQIERVNEIPRTERGKFRAVISRLSRNTGVQHECHRG
ncbi:MAG: phenylacetate--CoA ligase family protein [Pedosphaera sp.]|nr:phenylacetate--CoA ligase family protein [Pedosphaera sp.]